MGALLQWRPPDKRRSGRLGHPLPGDVSRAGQPTTKECSETPYRRQAEIVVRDIGHHFSQTVLKAVDGREHRLQVFADHHAARRCAEILNNALREARA